MTGNLTEQEKLIDKFMNTYSGRALKEKYDDFKSEKGVWHVESDEIDSTITYGTYNVTIGYFEGTLYDVICKALEDKRFMIKSSGDITKVEIQKL